MTSDEPPVTVPAAESSPPRNLLELVWYILRCPNMWRRAAVLFAMTLLFLLAVVAIVCAAFANWRRGDIDRATPYALTGAASACLVFVGTTASRLWKARKRTRRGPEAGRSGSSDRVGQPPDAPQNGISEADGNSNHGDRKKEAEKTENASS
jgi:hypothetical protein